MTRSRQDDDEGALWWLIVVALVALAAWAAPPVLAADMVTARVPEPFEVNGEVYPPGTLSVKEIGALSPVATLHEFRIDGESRGFVLVRPEAGAPASASTELGFSRAAAGHLVLASVAVAGRPEGTVHAHAWEGVEWPAGAEDPQATAVARKN